MKLLKSLSLLVLLLVALPTIASATDGFVQIVHNAPDPDAEEVDIYLNGELLLDNFAFRSATPFVPLKAWVTQVVGIAPGDSDGPEDIIAEFPFKLNPYRKYIVVANGVLGGGFAPNPDGKDIAFTLYTLSNAADRGRFGLVKVAGFHGSPDVGTVDIYPRGSWWPLFDDLMYGEFSRYRYLLPKEYVLDITPGNDKETVVASVVADMSGLRNGAALVLASGFFDPSMNNGGPGFAVIAVLPDGTVLELPFLEQVAKLQVIHNAADKLAEKVDVYVDGAKAIPGFEFRTATPFIDVPAGVPVSIAVAPEGSSSVNEAVGTFEFTFEAGIRYVAIANGVLGDGFTPNPDGRSIAFDVFPYGGTKEEAPFNLVYLLGFHGATDAPSVDIRVRGPWGWSWPFYQDLTYGDYSYYRLAPPIDVSLDVTPAGDPNTVVASFAAPLSALKGSAAVVFASGFLAPLPGDPAFGLFVALPDGTVLELPSAPAPKTLAKGTDAAQVPSEFALAQNYPNPFNPSTTIQFSLPTASNVELTVYNLLGQRVETLIDQQLEAGEHVVNFDAGALASGIYFYRLRTDDASSTRKMLLMK